MVENFTACTTPRVLPHLNAIACKGDTSADKTAQCLLPAQILALRKVLEGPKLRDGKAIYSDWPWDAGIGAQTGRGVTQGWRIWKMGGYASATNNGALIRLGAPSNSAVFRSPPLDIADSVTDLSRYALNVDLDEAYAAAHVKWGALKEASVDFMHADATDLSPSPNAAARSSSSMASAIRCSRSMTRCAGWRRSMRGNRVGLGVSSNSTPCRA
jgi:feruloyl esterase